MLLNRRAILMAQSTGGGGGGLPDTYQEVEYMTVERGSYVGNIGTIASGCNIITKFTMTSVDTTIDAIFSTDNSVGYSILVRPGGLYQFTIYRNGGLNNGYSSASNVTYIVDLADTTTISDADGNVLYTCSFNASTWTSPLYFMKWGNSKGMQGKIWYLKVQNSGTDVIHLVPCYDKNTNEAGFYDIIGGTFYTNQGSGSFTCGPDV